MQATEESGLGEDVHHHETTRSKSGILGASSPAFIKTALYRPKHSHPSRLWFPKRGEVQFLEQGQSVGLQGFVDIKNNKNIKKKKMVKTWPLWRFRTLCNNLQTPAVR